VEFLVVMRVGLGEVPAMSVTPQVQPASVGVTVQTNGRKVQVIFDRSDICKGTLTIWDGGQGAKDRETNGAKVIRHKLTERVNDTYENWRTENRFDFLAIR
jgi:hypothetical protein